MLEHLEELHRFCEDQNLVRLVRAPVLKKSIKDLKEK